MLKIFSRGFGGAGAKPSLDSIRFNTAGYRFEGEPQPRDVRVWFTDDGDSVALYLFRVPPDLPRVQTVDELRAWYARGLQASGGQLVETSVLRLADCAGVRVIFKVPQQLSGLTYVGSLTIPFRAFSFVVKVQCEEQGLTGFREAALLNGRLAAGDV